MLSGHYQGRLLSLISKLIKPKSILEIGTYTGYSTLCLLEGLEKKGLIHTIDHNEELLNIQNKFFERAKVSNRIKQYTGDAKEIIKKFKVKFDLIFIDADKENYPLYYDLVFDKLKSGGIIIADNILWSGKILEKVEKDDYATQSIINFNNKIMNDERVEKIILPIRDGLSLIRKI
jgi:predicted O-methyltransferase YrrM